ncbi:MAG: PAS domain S-box protein [Deltaproteobacteria bacterium]
MKPGKGRKNGFVKIDRVKSVKRRVKLRQEEDFYRNIVESTSDSLYMVDINCRYLLMNQPHLLRLGLPKGKVIGKTYGELHSPARAKEFADRVEMVFDTGKSMQFEHGSERDGRYFLQTMSPVKEPGPDGRITAIAVVSKDITEHRQAEELYRILTETSIAAVFIVQDGKFVFINASAIAYAGYAAEEIIGQYSDVIVHPDDKELVKMKNRELLAGRSNQAFEFRMVTKRNEVRWISQTVTPIHYQGRPAILGNAMDVTELKSAGENLQAASKRMRDIIEFLPDPTFVIDEKKEVIAWNRAIEEMTGVLKKDMIGKGDYAYAVPFYGYPRPIMIDLVECTDEEINANYDFVERKGNTIFAETQVPFLRGEKDVFLFGKASPFFDDMGNFYGGIETIRDITEQKRTEMQLIYLSTHDELTGLYNRTFFDTEVDRFALGRHFPLSFIAADVDDLKQVNDSQGHAMGDKLIQSAANVLKQSIRPDDILARIGGDEFAVLLPNTSEITAASILERIKKNIEVFNETCNGPSLSLSLGAAVAERGESLSKVFESADESMYREKALQKELRKRAIER